MPNRMECVEFAIPIRKGQVLLLLAEFVLRQDMTPPFPLWTPSFWSVGTLCPGPLEPFSGQPHKLVEQVIWNTLDEKSHFIHGS